MALALSSAQTLGYLMDKLAWLAGWLRLFFMLQTDSFLADSNGSRRALQL